MKVHRFKISFNTTGKIYGFTGKVAQGAFLGLLKKEGDMTADVLHFGNKKRPYSITPIRIGNPSSFNVTSLNEELSAHLSKILGNYQQQIITISDKNEELLAPNIETTYLNPEIVTKGTRIHMTFKSPALFSSVSRKSKTDPFPHLQRIWGDLVKVWNLFSKDTIDNLIVDRILQQVSTPFFDFRSVPIKLGQIKVIGFTGKISFSVKDGPHLEYLLPLAKLAGYFGIGGKRAMGFGNVEVRIKKGVCKN